MSALHFRGAKILSLSSLLAPQLSKANAQTSDEPRRRDNGGYFGEFSPGGGWAERRPRPAPLQQLTSDLFRVRSCSLPSLLQHCDGWLLGVGLGRSMIRLGKMLIGHFIWVHLPRIGDLIKCRLGVGGWCVYRHFYCRTLVVPALI